MFIVLLGAPGSGKGTVGKIIAEDLKLAHISTGDLFRENLKNETELGKEAKQYMDKGELVPDEVTIKMLKERLNGDDVENGAVLDGFPRTGVQAVSLDNMLKEMNAKVDMALNIDVPFDEIVERIANRRSCKGCSEIYNVVFNPPKVEGICDKCGGELYQREDQKPEVVENRLQVYSKTAEELINHYKKANILYDAKAGDKVGKTSYDVAKEVEEYIKNN
ncbi:MAG: adenylate kinase [Clostridia bacterium]|jgi:adenylate kinase|nr:adenylate kinase [Clostridium sp. CAG:452]HJJ03909.1 adenylate kinase [Clostridiaceae bacterium]